MKAYGFRLLLGLMLSGLLAACGGGSTPPTPLSITTTSLPGGQTSTAYNASLSAMGGTPPYTWTVKSGNLPAGLSLSSAGSISGIPTTAGASSFAVQVSDSASAAQSTSGNLSIAISGGTLQITTTSAATGTVGTPYKFQLEATGGVPPYTWAIASGSSLPAGLSLSTAGVVSGTPTASGTFNPSISVTDETTSNTTTQQVNFAMNPAGKPLPDGTYAFQFNGTAKDGNPVAINGAFQVTQGSIAIGFYNENELNQAPQANQTITGGSVSIGSNGLGQLELNLQNSAITFALAFPPSAATQSNDTDIRIIEFDDATGSGQRGSGVLKGSNPTASLSAIKGGYAFGLSGSDTHSQPTAVAGSFQADGLGNITSGSVDMNDNGTMTSSTLTGTYTTDPIGGGVITLKFGGNTLTYNYYQVSPTELLASSGDISSSTIPLVSGVALQQSGSFTNASFTAVNVLETTGSALESPGSFTPDVTLGLLGSDSNGNVLASYDEFKSTLLAPQSYTATYAVDASTGRTPLTSGGEVKLILYLVSNSRAVALGTDASASSGVTESQTGLPFSAGSLKGKYLGGTLPWPKLHAISLAAPDGAGNITFTSNTSGSKGLQSNVITKGTYAVNVATGRAPVTVTGNTTARILYVVSPSKTVLLSGESGGYLISFEQ